MKTKETIIKLWTDFQNQNWDNLAVYFTANATIYWPNTKEVFTVKNFIEVNKTYPGTWEIEIINFIETADLLISVVRVFSADQSFHAVSFFKFFQDKIIELVEYWGEDGAPPSWR